MCSRALWRGVCLHARTRRGKTGTSIRLCIPVHARAHSTLGHMRTYTLISHIYTCTHIHFSDTCIRTHMRPHTHTHHTRARTHTLTTYLYTLSSQINVSAHTCIRTRKRARTLTHTLTHTYTPTTYIHLQAYFSRENTTTNRRNMRRQRHVCLVSPAHSSQSVLSSYFGNESCFGPSASPRDAACKYVRLLAGRERWGALCLCRRRGLHSPVCIVRLCFRISWRSLETRRFRIYL